MTTSANGDTPYPTPVVAANINGAMVAANDRPDPVMDAGRSAQKYAGLAQDFRASAWEHLEKGDLPQASNKAWALVAETVKAISAHHGHILHTHRAIVEVVDRLTRLVGNAGDAATRRWISSSFMTARGLHTNFYENEMTEAIVSDSLETCEELSERLYQLFWPEGAPAIIAPPGGAGA